MPHTVIDTIARETEYLAQYRLIQSVATARASRYSDARGITALRMADAYRVQIERTEARIAALNTILAS